MRGSAAPESQYPQVGPCRSDILFRNDPSNCLSALFEAPSPLPHGMAEQALMAWLVTLPDGVDPAHAASELGTVPPFAEAGARGEETARLCALLEEIARYPAGSLSPPSRRRRQPLCA